VLAEDKSSRFIKLSTPKLHQSFTTCNSKNRKTLSGLNNRTKKARQGKLNIGTIVEKKKTKTEKTQYQDTIVEQRKPTQKFDCKKD